LCVQGPATQRPLAGSYTAPWIEQISQRPVSSKKRPGCQSISAGTWAQRFR
jgi:hypothetical protein